jgi:Domain of unknown function (DUF4167)
MRWHRAGFRCYWRWKSCARGGRPQIDTELRALIRRMGIENSLWGAPRIHGELLKLGFELAQSSVAKYMVKRRGPPSQGWRTFLRNHAAPPRQNTKGMTNAMPRRSEPARRNEPSGIPRFQARNVQNAQRNYERFLALARAEALTGDRIVAENYFQHAEHYFRSMGENPN